MSSSRLTSQSLSPDQLFDQLSTNRWMPRAVSVAAFVLLIYAMAQWTWRVLDSSAPSAAAARPPDTVPVARLDVQPLLAAQFFGQVQSPASVDPKQLPLSSLNIILTGVMARGRSSFAFLSVNGAPEMFLVIGQEVAAGAILEAVYPDRVVLRRGSALESVLLKDSDTILPPGSIASAGGEPVRALGDGRFSVNRQALTRSLTPQTLAQATATPSSNGLVMRSVQPGSVFEKLGLRAGDVVRYMNGQPVTTLEQALKIYAETMNAGEADDVSVEVSRGGKVEVLTYQVQRDQ